MASTNPNFLAGGTIAPMTFVSPDPSNDYRVIQATANSQISGVASDSTETAPLPGNSTNAATVGNPIRVYGEAEQCKVTYGATVVRGNYLKSDASGNAIPIATTGNVQNYGAIALVSGASGEIHNVQVHLGKTPATAS